MDQALQRQTSRSDDNQGLEEHCDLHIYRFIGAKKLSDLTVPACNAFADQLRDAGRSAETITPLRNEFRWPWDVGRRCVENSKRAFGRCAWCFPFSTPSALAVLVRSAPGDVFACFEMSAWHKQKHCCRAWETRRCAFRFWADRFPKMDRRPVSESARRAGTYPHRCGNRA
jgi:hypothetical protein